MIIYRKSDETVVIPCGLGPVVCPDSSYELQMKQIDSSTVLQYVEPDSGYYGLYRVIVNPLTDGNLLPGNIKEGVEILGVMGTYAGTVLNLQAKTANPLLVEQVITFDYPHNGLSSVTIAPVTSDIDPDIQAGNIKRGVEILGVTGTFDGGPLQSKTVNSSTASQTVEPDNGNYGLSSVTVNPYTLESKTQNITLNGTYSFTPTSANGLSSVDISVNVADIPAVVQSKSVTYNENGEYTVTPDQGYDGLSSVDISVNIPPEPVVLQSKTVDSSTSSQSVTYDNEYDGLSSVTVNPYTLDSKTVDPSTSQITVNSSVDGLSSVTVNAVTSNIDSDIQAGNIKRGVEILGVTGTFDGGSLGTKTVNSSTSSQTITPESSDYGLSSVTVNPYILDSKTVNSSTAQQVVTSSEDGLSSVTVNPYTVETNSSTLTVNGTYTFTPQNADALSSVTVDVSVDGQVINNQSKTVNSSTSTQIVNFDSGYTGLSQVTVNPYTLDSKTVDSSTVSQVVTSSEDGLSSVTVNPYTVETDSSTLTQNGTYTFSPVNADALSGVTVNVSVDGQVINNQNKTVNPSTNSQSITADSGYTGLGTVTVNPMNLQTGEYDPYTYSYGYTEVNPSTGYDGLSKVKVYHPVTKSITINPSTNVQVKTPGEYSGEYIDSVTVNGVTSSIDSNITAGNIKDGVTILGVTGNYSGSVINNQSKTVNSSTSSQTVNFDSGYTGLSSVTVNPYVLDSKTVDPSTSQQVITSDEDGLSSVTVNAVTSSIDPDIQAGNIKRGVEILGVTGTFDGGSLGVKTVDSSTVSQTITPDSSDYGLSSVTVNPYTVETKSVTLTNNGSYTYTPTTANAFSSFNVDVSVGGSTLVLQTKSITANTTFPATILPDAGYDGFSELDIDIQGVDYQINAVQSDSSVSDTSTYDVYAYVNKAIVRPVMTDAVTVDASINQQVITPVRDAINQVTVNAVDASIDSNIQAGNIKSGVTILGVQGTFQGGTLQSKTVDASSSSQTITPDSPNYGLSNVTVNAAPLQSKTVDISSSTQTITPDSPNYGLSSVTVNAAPLQNRTVDASVNQIQVSRATTDYYGLRTVTINAVTSSIDSNIVAGNIKKDVTILGVTGTYEGGGAEYDEIYAALIEI